MCAISEMFLYANDNEVVYLQSGKNTHNTETVIRGALALFVILT